MELREASLKDAGALSKLGAATFAGTFQHLYSAKNLSRFLAEFHSEAYYKTALKDQSVKIWVIETAGELVGYTKIGPNSLPCVPPRPHALELSRLYLREPFQNQGLGARLMDQIIDYAQSHDYPEIVLSVYAENLGGQKFYRRYGFEKIGDYHFVVGDHLDAEFIFSVTL